MSKKERKKVFIYAYTKINLGDDLFVKMLCDRYPTVDFLIVSSKNESKPYKEIKNLQVIYEYKFIDKILNKFKIQFRFNNLLRRRISKTCDAVVNIGGSIFMEDKYWKKKTKYYKQRIIKDIPYFIIGSNFGPYKNTGYVDIHKDIFSMATDVCFRDQYSYNLFEDLENVRLESDVVYALKHNTVSNDKKHVTFSIINLEKRASLVNFQNEYINKMTSLTKKFIDEGYKVTLMGFCKYEDDDKAIELIINNLDKQYKKNITSYIYDGNIEQSLDIINKSKIIVGARFHATILGLTFNKKVLPVLYSDKTLNALNDIDFKGQYMDIKTIDIYDTDEIFRNIVSYRELNIEKQIHSANSMFSELDKILS